MVYQSKTVERLMSDAGKLYSIFKNSETKPRPRPRFTKCGLCGGNPSTSNRLASLLEPRRDDFGGPKLGEKECAAAFVFFRSRYAALIASQSFQSSHPTTWVTDLAPEPRDVYWANLCLPYEILWIRKIFSVAASVLLGIFYLAPIMMLHELLNFFPFLDGIFERGIMDEIISGYLPSVLLLSFLCLAPPLMFFFTTLEGSISRSHRKRSTCIKVLCFMIWNVFFGTFLSGSVLDRIGRASNVRTISLQLGRSVPIMAKFFMTYVMTSGWAILSFELIQPFGLLYSLYRYILRHRDDSSYHTMTFPYHTEVPRVLLFGLLGFTYSFVNPLILPFLLVFFSLAYLVYRNQFLNVYETKYQSGGLYWPIVHNSTIFSLVVTQLTAVGVFALKKSNVASSFMIPLIIATLIFNEYCRQRFHPIFTKTAAQVVIEMDRRDDVSMRSEEIYSKLSSVYRQFSSSYITLGQPILGNDCETDNGLSYEESKDLTQGSPTLGINQ